MNAFISEISSIQKIHKDQNNAEGNCEWDPLVYEMLNLLTDECILVNHGRLHGTARDCMEILAQGGLDITNITPVVTQVGTMKYQDGVRRNIMVSHYGETFEDSVRKAAARSFGLSGKAGKEFLRSSVEEVPELIGLPVGVSSPFIDRNRYSNFENTAMVIDKSIVQDTIAIAVNRNTTLLMSRADFELIIGRLAEVNFKLQIVRFS